ncbi:hypothetical protein JTB14_003322 [Gonioctena quinquepunctata]|nr:hypothetical protein JTB14_003322 [Gonioctena quinquepunctata]
MGDELNERRAQNLEVANPLLFLCGNNGYSFGPAPQPAPRQSDIAAVFEGSRPPINVDLILYPHRPDDPHPRNRHHELKLLNPDRSEVYHYYFLAYNGYSGSIQSQKGRPVDKTVTILQYYRYRLYIRDIFSTLHHGGKLFQQYIVDGWVKNEMNRLWWFREHQNDFRRTAEEALRRYNRSRRDGHVGKVIILPAAFPGGGRYRQRQYFDAMTGVARFGKPALFITFTCNPNWPVIRNNLMPYQKWENRPDLVCRVFKLD